MKILKWAGILALLSLPIVFLARKKRSAEQGEVHDEDNNIFAEELAG